MASDDYKLKYGLDLQAGSFQKEDATGGAGLADALVLFSMIFPPDGSASTAIVSLDGRTNEDVTDIDLFRCFSVLAHRLSGPESQLPEGSWQRTIAGKTHEAIKAVLAEMRRKEGG